MLDDHAVFHPEQVIEGVVVPFHWPSLTVRTKLPSPSTAWISVYWNMLPCAVSASTAATIPQARPRYRVVLGVALGADVVGDP
jgi:hypothetical protein